MLADESIAEDPLEIGQVRHPASRKVAPDIASRGLRAAFGEALVPTEIMRRSGLDPGPVQMGAELDDASGIGDLSPRRRGRDQDRRQGHGRALEGGTRQPRRRNPGEDEPGSTHSRHRNAPFPVERAIPAQPILRAIRAPCRLRPARAAVAASAMPPTPATAARPKIGPNRDAVRTASNRFSPGVPYGPPPSRHSSASTAARRSIRCAARIGVAPPPAKRRSTAAPAAPLHGGHQGRGRYGRAPHLAEEVRRPRVEQGHVDVEVHPVDAPPGSGSCALPTPRRRNVLPSWSDSGRWAPHRPVYGHHRLRATMKAARFPAPPGWGRSSRSYGATGS